MSINKPYQSPDELPDVLPVFPLAGVLLLPRVSLPLTVFEARYLDMFDDALKSHRLIGIIQPEAGENEHKTHPDLYSVGCVGRITQFAETGDGRYLVALTGVARFKVMEELNSLTSYRQCHVSYDDYRVDFVPSAGEQDVNRNDILRTLRNFAKANDLKIDWKSIEKTPNEPLVNELAMMSPFGPKEKQALLEAKDLKLRAETLVAIAEIELARGQPSARTLQ
ncbi:LON peptidase substrate-binding domain-containing protein [Methylovirgula sp. 4M-Z18]|uniref:LON peptidase substrate-binding domain-containing protein n=1 Tax=Methylovirgula sp. 4M-Z18 TaxID=2293567 RepID=UPI000E2F7F7C|nr:LON peptidase substrate-binding domain-containing protein [Methylovirgula sp. 4M-Z18]RFB74967.1 peptidase S16 [Methylovirgula sp. 4M-Z18]